MEIILGLILGSLFFGGGSTTVIMPKEEKKPRPKMTKKEYEKWLKTPVTYDPSHLTTY